MLCYLPKNENTSQSLKVYNLVREKLSDQSQCYVLNGVRRIHTKGNKGRKLKLSVIRRNGECQEGFPRGGPQPRAGLTTELREGRVMNIYVAPAV